MLISHNATPSSAAQAGLKFSICHPAMPYIGYKLTRHSDRQPVPDNQEAFLTLSGPLDARLIFEIAEYITPRDQLHDADGSLPQALDLAALKYYVDDLLSVTEDNWKNTDEPRKIVLGPPSMKAYSAYYLEAQIFAQTGTKAGSHGDVPGTSLKPHSALYLLFVRASQHGSEFVVQMIVKHGQQNPSDAEQVMFRIAETLEFKSFDALVG